MWPLPKGIAYNSYLIKDEKVALVDGVEIGQVEKYLKKIRAIIGDQAIDYLIINHMEPDHGGAIDIIKKLYPDIKIVGNKKTLQMLEGYFGITDNIVEVKDKGELNLGKHTLNFYTMPMVHWPEVMTTYDNIDKVLFSADAFGSFGTIDGGIFDDQFDFDANIDEMRRYYSNIVGKYGSPVQKALSKFTKLGIDIKIIASTHGHIIRENIDKVLSLYNQWSTHEGQKGVVVAYASMYGNTEDMAEAVAHGLADSGINNIVLYDVSKTHSSYIISDVFKYKGVILASPTYCNELHPNMESLITKFEHIGVANKLLGIVGSFSWASAAVKKLNVFAENIKWDLVSDAVEEKHALKEEKYEACYNLGKTMAEKL